VGYAHQKDMEKTQKTMNLKPSSNHKIYIQALRQMTQEKRLLKAFEKEAQLPIYKQAIYGLIIAIQVLRRNKIVGRSVKCK